MPEDELHARLANIEHMLSRMESHLIGDSEFGQLGLFDRVRDVEESVRDHSSLVANVKARIMGALATATFLGGFLNWLLGYHAADK